MKEESRIEALEHELKILKNEIQSTLLEIREQILNHYYPELRAEEPLRSHSLPVRPAVGRPGMPVRTTPRSEELETTLSEIAAKGQIHPFSDIFLDDLDDDEPSDMDADTREDDYDDEYEDNDDELRAALTDAVSEAEDVSQSTATTYTTNASSPINAVSATVNHGSAAPTTREVDFRKLKQSSTAPTAQVAAKPTSAPMTREYVREEVAISAEPKANRVNMAALTAWVTDGVARVGKEQTLQIIDTYASGGKLNEVTKHSLIRMVSKATDFEPEQPVGSRVMLTLMVELDQILE